MTTLGLFRTVLAERRCLETARRWPSPAWEAWRNPDGEILRSFTIITTSANDTLAELHERMPVLLEPADWQVGLS